MELAGLQCSRVYASAPRTHSRSMPAVVVANPEPNPKLGVSWWRTVAVAREGSLGTGDGTGDGAPCGPERITCVMWSGTSDGPSSIRKEGRRFRARRHRSDRALCCRVRVRDPLLVTGENPEEGRRVEGGDGFGDEPSVRRSGVPPRVPNRAGDACDLSRVFPMNGLPWKRWRVRMLRSIRRELVGVEAVPLVVRIPTIELG